MQRLFRSRTGNGTLQTALALLGDMNAVHTAGAAPLAQASPNHAATAGPRVVMGVADEQGPRPYMEDRNTLIQEFRVRDGADVPRQYAAVFDGHSSARGSAHAAKRVHEFIASQPAIMQCKGEAGSLQEAAAVEAALKEAFLSADDEIVGLAVDKGKRYGTTAVCALRVGAVLYVAHAGDSRAVLCRGGTAVQLTQDHKPVSVPQERQRIEAAGGELHSDDRVVSNPEGIKHSRLNMSRALGDPDFKAPRRLVEAEPDVARVPLQPGLDAFLILGSDGLFDVLENDEAVAVVQRRLISAAGAVADAGAASQAAQDLVQAAMRMKTQDNVTALVMAFLW